MLTFGFNHLALAVTNLNLSKDWYHGIFEFIIKEDNSSTSYPHIFFEIGNQQELGLFENKNEKYVHHKTAGQFPHIVLKTDSAGFKQVIENLKNIDVKYSSPANSGEGIGSYFRDPDGYSIEILQTEM